MYSAETTERAITEVNGLIVDETITKVGQDFYEVFYSQWAPPESELTYTISIKELPLPGRGSQITVHLNNTEIFTQPIPPRYEVVESLAEYAVNKATQYVRYSEDMSRQLSNEDQKGNGIF